MRNAAQLYDPNRVVCARRAPSLPRHACTPTATLIVIGYCSHPTAPRKYIPRPRRDQMGTRGTLSRQGIPGTPGRRRRRGGCRQRQSPADHRGKPPRPGQWSLPGGGRNWASYIEAAIRERGKKPALPSRSSAIDVVDSSPRQIGAGTLHLLADVVARPVGGTLQTGGDASEALVLAGRSSPFLWSSDPRHPQKFEIAAACRADSPRITAA